MAIQLKILDGNAAGQRLHQVKIFQFLNFLSFIITENIFPLDSRYVVSTIQQGGYLKIFQVAPPHDSGMYTCIIKSRNGEEARREIQVNVNSPPVIEPFSFPKNLQEGGRAQISCAVSSGDMPVYFNWHKDGAPISLGLQVMEQKGEFFTLLVFKDITARHSGKYTCFATNSAAKVNFTAELFVKGERRKFVTRKFLKLYENSSTPTMDLRTPRHKRNVGQSNFNLLRSVRLPTSGRVLVQRERQKL